MSALNLGVRRLVKRPLVSLLSALCLALGIAATAVAWALLDAGVLRPFGLREAHRLVILWESDPARNHPLIEVSYLNFLDWQRESRTVDEMAAFGSQHWPGLARIGGESVPLALRGVSSTFFPTLGIDVALGRNFEAGDARADTAPPIILSDRLWKARFGAAADIVGRRVFIDGLDHVVIGVMPRGFAYPDDPDAWVSVERVLGEAFSSMPVSQQRMLGVLQVLARRAPSVTGEQVRAEITAIVQALQRQHSSGTTAVTTIAVVTPFTDVLLGRLGSRIWIALAMSAAVFLLACANVAAVRAAQLRERAPELAARRFLGARRVRLLRELSIEAVPLVALGAVFAGGGTIALLRMLSAAAAMRQSGVDLGDHALMAVAWSGVLALVSLLLVGVLPAALASRQPLADAQLSAARTTRRTSRIGTPLLVGQAATAVAVVALATVAIDGFARLSRIDVGFATSGVTLIDLAVPGWKYPDAAAARQLIERLQTELRTLASVKQVAAVSIRPFRFGEIGDGLPVRRGGESLVTVDEATAASRVVVTTDYFAAMGQTLVAGRAFTTADREGGELVAIISRTLARALFGDHEAVGRHIETFSLSEKWRARRIVGVAGDAQYRGLERPSLEVYVPHTQVAAPLGSLVIASDGPLSHRDIRAGFTRVEPDLAIERIQTTAALRTEVLSPARLLASIMSLLGATGLLLLTIGIFAASAAAVRAAWGEIAIRQAIGARPYQAARAPLARLQRAVVVGVAVGAAVTPVILSAASAWGLSTGSSVGPIAAAMALVPVAAAAAVAPSLMRAASLTPSVLLREN
jgi:predicted permease